jgi:23S rRNA (guanosine2251-2'-O)-methyltransferase
MAPGPPPQPPQRRGGRRASAATGRPGAEAVLYGRNAVREALRGPRAVRQVWATERAAREPWLRGACVQKAAAEEIERRCGSPDHQGVCAEAEAYRYADADALLAREDALVVALDEVQDPQNLGAICRTAECAGATGVVLPERRSAEVTPAVCKASAGAVEHLAIARVRNLADFLLAARSAGAWSYGADGAARVPYTAPDYRGKVVLVMGSEGRGLRQRVAGSCDELVALPLRGRIGSLNVSAAAAALLYEITRQRG